MIKNDLPTCQIKFPYRKISSNFYSPNHFWVPLRKHFSNTTQKTTQETEAYLQMCLYKFICGSWEASLLCKFLKRDGPIYLLTITIVSWRNYAPHGKLSNIIFIRWWTCRKPCPPCFFSSVHVILMRILLCSFTRRKKIY